MAFHPDNFGRIRPIKEFLLKQQRLSFFMKFCEQRPLGPATFLALGVMIHGL
jgi:hypothetical protein